MLTDYEGEEITVNCHFIKIAINLILVNFQKQIYTCIVPQISKGTLNLPSMKTIPTLSETPRGIFVFSILENFVANKRISMCILYRNPTIL